MRVQRSIQQRWDRSMTFRGMKYCHRERERPVETSHASFISRTLFVQQHRTRDVLPIVTVLDIGPLLKYQPLFLYPQFNCCAQTFSTSLYYGAALPTFASNVSFYMAIYISSPAPRCGCDFVSVPRRFLIDCHSFVPNS